MIKAPIFHVTVVLMLGCVCTTSACLVTNSIRFGGLYADCRSESLHQVPMDLQGDIVALDLSGNNISTLTNETFKYYPSLEYLNLDWNVLESMESKSFQGLCNLSYLSLAHNRLTESIDAFPDGIYDDLTNLQTLNLERNMMASYPDCAFVPLRSLRALYLQSVAKPTFGEGFSHLEQLSLLRMDSGSAIAKACAICEISDATFYNLRNLRLDTLIIKHCHRLFTFHENALYHLHYLSNFQFVSNPIGVAKALRILKPLGGRNMTRIDLSKTFNKASIMDSPASNCALTVENTQFLTNICLTHFSFRSNFITVIHPDAIFRLPFRNSLEMLDFSENPIIGDGRIYIMLSLFQNLKTLIIQNNLLTHNRNKFGELYRKYDLYNVTLPKSLEYIDISGMRSTHVTGNATVAFTNAGKLETIIFKNNEILFTFHLMGLEHTKVLDFSENNMKIIIPDFFSSFRNIHTLSVRSCNLRFNDNNTFLFKTLEKLENLDLSQNFLTLIPALFNPARMKVLNLSANALENISLTMIRDFQQLRTLDISYNSISSLDSVVMEALDRAYDNRQLTVSISGNTFFCGCQNLDFILWLVNSKVIWENDRNFHCIQDDGSTTTSVVVAENYLKLVRQCNGKALLILTITAFSTFLMAVSMTYAITRNPNRYKRVLLKLFCVGTRLRTHDEFRYKLYVGHCSTDIPFVYRKLRIALESGIKKLRLFLKDREAHCGVLPGDDIADGIIEGINTSWKTLLLISPDFLLDQWSSFTLKSAVYSITDLIPNRILVLLVGDIQVDDLPASLLNAVEEEFILHVDDYLNEERMWKHIQELVYS